MKTVLSILLSALLLLSGAAAAESRAVIPDLEIPEKTIPDNAALALVREMKAGWNLGNTFDAVNCTWLQNPLDYESGWCGIKTSRKLIRAVKEAGFRTLRLPVSWRKLCRRMRFTANTIWHRLLSCPGIISGHRWLMRRN